MEKHWQLHAPERLIGCSMQFVLKEDHHSYFSMFHHFFVSADNLSQKTADVSPDRVYVLSWD